LAQEKDNKYIIFLDVGNHNEANRDELLKSFHYIVAGTHTNITLIVTLSSGERYV